MYTDIIIFILFTMNWFMATTNKKTIIKAYNTTARQR